MYRKLTLSIDEDLIDSMKSYSRETRQTLSSLVEKYFESLTIAEKPVPYLTQTSNELYGIFEDNPLPDKKVMRERFYEKSSD